MPEIVLRCPVVTVAATGWGASRTRERARAKSAYEATSIMMTFGAPMIAISKPASGGPTTPPSVKLSISSALAVG